MSTPLRFDLTVEKYSDNKLNDDKVLAQARDITAAAKRSNTSSVTAKHTKVTGPIEKDDRYYYIFEVSIEKAIARSEGAALKMLEQAKVYVMRAANARSWVATEKGAAQENAAIAKDRATFEVGNLNDTIMKKYFNGIYEREPHIRLVHDSVKSYVESAHEDRNHMLLYGPPASCKTTILKRFKVWYEDGQDVERIALVNSTTISKAGLETWILQKAQEGTLPNILCFDEIEKFNMDNLMCLLTIMDDQGIISRTNARIGKQEAPAKILVWATCNDELKIKDFNRGALYSRFAKTLPCVRPSKELMKEILLKKIEKRRAMGREAKDKWAEIIINYAWGEMKTNDPRKILGLLDGGVRLEDGSYFRDLNDIDKAYKLAKENNLLN